MSNNFRRTAVRKKYMNCKLKLHSLRALHAPDDLEPYRQIYGKSKESLWRNLSTDKPPNFIRTSFALQL